MVLWGGYLCHSVLYRCLIRWAITHGLVTCLFLLIILMLSCGFTRSCYPAGYLNMKRSTTQQESQPRGRATWRGLSSQLGVLYLCLLLPLEHWFCLTYEGTFILQVQSWLRVRASPHISLLSYIDYCFLCIISFTFSHNSLVKKEWTHSWICTNYIFMALLIICICILYCVRRVPFSICLDAFINVNCIHDRKKQKCDGA